MMNLGPYLKTEGIIAHSHHSIIWKGHRRCDETELYAIKQAISLSERSGIHAKRCLLEILLLQHFNHDNIIRLFDVCFEPFDMPDSFDSVYLLLPRMDCDLAYLNRIAKLPMDTVRIFTLQILKALKYIHSAKVIHRDLKPQNVLVKLNTLELVVCDFGTGRQEQALAMSRIKQVTTVNYRSPESMLFKNCYDSAIDLWSLGCILCELLLHCRDPFFPGEDNNSLMGSIISTIGTPCEILLASYRNQACSASLLQVLSSSKNNRPNLESQFPVDIPSDARSLVASLLKFDPKERITASTALAHPFLEEWHTEIESENVCEEEFVQPSFINSTVGELKKNLWQLGNSSKCAQSPDEKKRKRNVDIY